MRPAAIVRSEQPRQTDRQLLEAGHRRLVSSVLTQEVRRQHVIIRRGQLISGLVTLVRAGIAVARSRGRGINICGESPRSQG